MVVKPTMMFGLLGLDPYLIFIMLWIQPIMVGPKWSLFSRWWPKTVMRQFFARNLFAQGRSRIAKVPLQCPELDHFSQMLVDSLSLTRVTFPFKCSNPFFSFLYFVLYSSVSGFAMMREYSICMWALPFTVSGWPIGFGLLFQHVQSYVREQAP